MSTQVGIGKSIHRNPRIAASEAVEMALRTGAIEKADFVFMFSSVGYDQKTIVKHVYDFFGGAPLCGCSAEGTIAGWETDESNFSVVVMAICSDELRFTNGIVGGLKSNSAEAGHAVAESLREKVNADTAGLFLFPDALTVNFERFKTALEDALDLEHLLPLLGGTASDNWQWKQTYQYCNDQVISDSVAWALLSGKIQIAWAINHGCVSLGVSHKITRCEGNVIHEIDGKPSMETLRKYLSETDLTKGWGTSMSQFPLGFKVPDSVTEDYGQFFLRAMMSKDDQTGAVTVPTEVSQGETFYMTRRDYELVVSGVDRLGSQIKQQIGAKQPKMVLQFDCAARGKLFMREEQQSALLKTLHETIGSDVPWLGFYTYGEIGPLAGINHVHNYTCVVATVY
jgi:hypothetical protein